MVGSYTIRFRTEAQQDFAREYRYSKRQWGEKHAKKHFADLRASIGKLANHPMAHPGIGGRASDWRCMSTIRGLKVAYRVDVETMIIDIFAIVGQNRFHKLEALIQKHQPSMRQQTEGQS